MVDQLDVCFNLAAKTDKNAHNSGILLENQILNRDSNLHYLQLYCRHIKIKAQNTQAKCEPVAQAMSRKEEKG